MPGQFVQSYCVRLHIAGQEGNVEPTLCAQVWVFADVAGGKTSCSGGAMVGAVSEEVALFAKVAKFVGMTWFPTILCPTVNAAVHLY